MAAIILKRILKKGTRMSLRPLGDRVIIKQEDELEMTAGGLYIPDKAKEKPQEGLVVEVGPGTPDYKMELKKGDKVLYSKYSGTDVKDGKEEYIVIRESEILAVREGDNE